MMRYLLVLIAALALSSCAARAIDPATGRPVRTADLPPTPEWTTAEGKLQAQLDIASTLVEREHWDRAMDLVRKLRSEGVTDPTLDLLQGRILVGTGLPTQALPLLESAARRLKKDPRPHRALGLLHADARRLDEAIFHLDRATKLAPNDAATWNNLGFVYMAAQDHDSALTALTEAVRLDSARVRYRNNLAYALVYTEDVAQALQTFRTTSKTEAEAQARLGVALEAAGESEQAFLHYGKALQLDPQQPEAVAGAARMTGQEKIR